MAYRRSNNRRNNQYKKRDNAYLDLKMRRFIDDIRALFRSNISSRYLCSHTILRTFLRSTLCITIKHSRFTHGFPRTSRMSFTWTRGGKGSSSTRTNWPYVRNVGRRRDSGRTCRNKAEYERYVHCSSCRVSCVTFRAI